MKFREMKRTGFLMSEIGLGGEHLIGKSEGDVRAVVEAALAGGINVFDLFMPYPEIRDYIGRILAPVRKDVIMQGHLGTIMEDGQGKRSRDIEKCKISFEDYLKRYRTDYVDIGMIHFIDTEEDYNEVFHGELYRYAMELKKEGVLRSFGISSHDPVIAEKAVREGGIDALMFSINPAYDLLPENTNIYDFFKEETYAEKPLFGINPKRAKLYELCEAMNVNITVMKTIGAGQLLAKETSPFGREMTVPQCIHYALQQPAVSTALIGFSEAWQVEEALKYYSISDEEKDYSRVLADSPKYSMNGRCMYCNHCLPCPSHIDIAMVTKYLYLAEAFEGKNIPDTIREHYGALNRKASDCIRCGNCEPNCPFHVSIRKNMEKAMDLFER